MGGQYREETRTLADGRTVPVFVLTSSTASRRFLLTNPDGYSLTYNGLVMVVEKRRSNGWQALGSYTFSRTEGLLASSGATAADPQVSTVAPAFPTAVNVRARSEQPHQCVRAVAERSAAHVSGDGHDRRATDRRRRRSEPAVLQREAVGGDGADCAASGRPAHSARAARVAPAVVAIAARRARVEDVLPRRRGTRIELLFDVLNALNDTAEEALATDNLFSPNFGQPTVFMDPRRAMLSVRLNLGH